jgi:hypothetical protein
MRKYGIDELCACVRREIGQRKRVYGRMVKESKMDEETAQKEIEMMQEICENLEEQRQGKLF